MVGEKVKDTEIGFIPESWDYISIKTIDPSKGAVQTGPFGSILHSYDYADEGIPLLLVKNIVEGSVVENGVPRVNFEKANELKKFWLKEGDIVFTRVGAVGRTLYVTKEYEGWMFSGQTLRIRINNPDVNNKFVEFYFRSPQYQSLSESTSLGSTRASINTSILANTNIPLPSKEEQDKIVEILLSIDQKIELNHQMNQTLEALGQAIFWHWFIDFEFPDENGMPYKSNGGAMVDSELGKIPQGWEVGKLDKYVNMIKGCSYKSVHLTKANNALVTLKSVGRDGIFKKNGFKEYSGDFKREQVIIDGDVVIAQTDLTQKAEVLGKPVIVRTVPHYQKLIASLDLAIVRPKNGHLNKEFIYEILKTKTFHNHAISYANGTTVLHLSKEAVPNYETTIPPKKIIDNFKRILKPIFDKINFNNLESENLSHIRDSLLPKLMSGKIRVPLEDEK